MNRTNTTNKIIIAFITLIILIPKITSDCLGSDSAANKFDYYRLKYKVECVSDKITNNIGNGFDSLYGTRNMRTILFGVAYRGGGNNFYHKSNKRDNHNPLPPDGLQNLSEQGFSKAVYLYSTNFASSEKQAVSKLSGDTLKYIQNSGMSSEKMKEIMLLVLESINNPETGPIYFHCWNGWHQSGYIASAILMQFCGYSNDDALEYWNKNTDGVNKGYENVKKLVKSFKPFPDIKISEQLKQMICPCKK